MRPVDKLNNLSQEPCGSALESTTENNSESSDSDMEVLVSADADQKRIIQGLKRTIRRNQTKLNDLAAKLTIAEANLASEKEKTKDKEDVIKSLNLSIDLLKNNSGRSINKTACEQHTTIIDELNADIEILECKLKDRNEKISKLEDKTEKYEINLKYKDDHIAELESQINIFLDTTQKYEGNLKEKDEHIAKLESQAKTDAAKIEKLVVKLSKFTLQVETNDDNRNSLVFLNCTKIPSIQFVKHPTASDFAAVFEDLPSAGPGWMVIQRRVDGSIEFHKETNYECGFGDLSREFWLGLDIIHKLTTSQEHELYIELVDFDNATAYARYDNFMVGDKANAYRIARLGKYSGNAGNFLRTGDFLDEYRTNDGITWFYKWWSGGTCNLNGCYYRGKTMLNSVNGIWWGQWNMNRRHALKSCKMLIRPRS